MRLKFLFQLSQGWCHVTSAKLEDPSACPKPRVGNPLACVPGVLVIKMSCQTNGAGSRKMIAEVKYVEEQEESSASDEGSYGSGKRWMVKFSTMKVVPPKGANHACPG